MHNVSMKFATPSWDDETPEAWAAFGQSLRSHYERMRAILPPQVMALAELRGVDDGLIVAVCHDRQRRVLHLTLRCGDLVMGYYDLKLTYEGADISPTDERLLARIARSTVDQFRHESDLVRQELDVTADGGIEHRLEFHVHRRPNVWLAVQCQALQWKTVSRPNRDLPTLPDRFTDSPITGG